MVETQMRNRGDLVLPPGTYAYVLDSTKGRVSVFVGPSKTSLSDTDQVVVWDTEEQRYTNVDSIDKATQTFALAAQGEYIVLTNPATSDNHPAKGAVTDAAELDNGRRVIVPGPATFPLWPGQTAKTIEGHHLRHNQYVVVRVYDADQARENFSSAVMAPQIKAGDGEEAAIIEPTAGDASGFTMGQLMVIPGTQVSFYMPSTGFEVVPEGDPLAVADPRNFVPVTSEIRYVRNAVTLETLEYCILLDEAGTKRYVRGPAVVFPNPTETFLTNEDESRVFDALELNEQSGIYVKVIEYYVDEGTTHPVGEELFITGADMPIYFPRAEHSIITYGGRRKHHAIAVPAGEGRYVLDRRTGDVVLHKGPVMLLPDPRYEVIVRRILDPNDVTTMFPGNQEALQINAAYAAQRKADAQDYLENAEVRKSLRADRGQRAAFAGNESPILATAASAQNLSPGATFLGDTLSRGTQYTPPRTITLDTKYEGAVAVGVYPGYAILVTDKTGNRHVEVGPKVALLEYDETIMALNLSTGTPKSDARLLRTGYLRIVNNVVSDVVTVETKDLVEIEIKISYRVNFEGTTPAEQQQWFNVENYVQVLTDHCRSRLRNIAKRSEVLDFYTNVIDIVRDTLLGTPDEDGERPGLPFTENGMRVYDVEILGADITNEDVETLLTNAQNAALTGAIELSVAEATTTRNARLEELKRSNLLEIQTTANTQATIELGRIRAQMDARLAGVAADIATEAERQKVEEKRLEIVKAADTQQIELEQAQNEIELARLTAETDELVKRMAAVTPGMIESLQAFSDTAIAERIVTAVGPAALAAGLTSGDMLARVFENTPFEDVVKAFTHRPFAELNR